ncbi:hypothetical protein [Inhella crocodyli]|uniref:DUF2007 domain-containing protein n=1 Tax=Inhella crocodyli TaxID=2499851 RepID=A0A3S2UCV5_9BURK|nr:hypothetical protein [Inhella crocodyli]RVT82438.1 hypothetical protein EOD73_17040 [Inhella crocodyli]
MSADDWVLLARGLSATDAQLLSNCLHMAGLQADAGDVGIVQAHGLLSIAVGGACVRVPAEQLGEAREVLAAFHRGDFSLDDDFAG